MADAIPTFKPHRPGKEARPSSSKRGYDAAWRRRRLRQLRDHPICQRCQRKPAEHVDHVKRLTELRRGEEERVQSLCHSCHSELTVAFDGGLGREKRDDKPNYGGSEHGDNDTDTDV